MPRRRRKARLAGTKMRNGVFKGRMQNGVLKGVSKKDFTAIARILCEHGASDSMVSEFASYFRSQNPRFDSQRFYAAAVCKRR